MSRYVQGKLVIGILKVVNDSAEGGIKLIEDFKETVTKDEHQKQFLLIINRDCGVDTR